jgi:hypothetical protein
MLPVREARVSSPATPSPRPGLKAAAAAALLELLRLSTNVALFIFPASLCACSMGAAIHVLSRWICGEGSAVEETSWAILVRAMGLLLRLLPAFFPLLMYRLYEYVNLVVEEVMEKVQIAVRLLCLISS